jgi:hypothetical protein
MKLSILTVYNEVEIIQKKIEWDKANGLTTYVIDNYSNDGTFELLQHLGVPCHRFSTDGAFHLDRLQGEIIRTVHTIRPEWIVYSGADLYFRLSEIPLSDYLDRIDADVISCRCATIYKLPAFGIEGSRIKLVHRYTDNFRYIGDDVHFLDRDSTTFYTDRFAFNYGGMKTAAQRQETYERRKKAWEQGLDPRFGSHYEKGAKKNWAIDEEKLIDLCAYII